MGEPVVRLVDVAGRTVVGGGAEVVDVEEACADNCRL